jgi:hypothetical protein
MLRWVWLSLVAACGFEHGTLTGGGDDGGLSGGDGSGSSMIDAAAGTADAQQCWSIASVTVGVCLDAPLTGSITVSSNTSIDTGSSGTGALQCKNLRVGSTDVCVIGADSITIDGMRTLSAHGARPLVLVAASITINGTIDVASHVNGQSGPGANMPGCNAGNPPDANAGGGGQGGSFGGVGGAGGNQDGQASSRGTPGMTIAATTLRGGCPGADGGDGGGGGGDGGGAVLLVANAITFGMDGKINASGASGRGASAGRKGGGGAGSGGMIAFDAMTITIGGNTQLWANGGHGGGGSSNQNAGTSGTDSTSPPSTGGGGFAFDSAGDGGRAYPSGSRDGASGNGGGDGGGGGGGGAGVIHNDSSASLGSQVSPPPS